MLLLYFPCETVKEWYSLFPYDVQVPHPTMPGEFVGPDPMALRAEAIAKDEAAAAKAKGATQKTASA